MATGRKQSLNSIHLDRNRDSFDDESEVLLEKFADDGADGSEATEGQMETIFGSNRKVKYTADESLESYSSDDVDAFLQGVNQKYVQEHEAAVEAARWKPSTSEKDVSGVEVADLDLGYGEETEKGKTSSKSESTGKNSVLSAFGAFIGVPMGSSSGKSSSNKSSSNKRTDNTRTSSARTSGSSVSRSGSSGTKTGTGVKKSSASAARTTASGSKTGTRTSSAARKSSYSSSKSESAYDRRSSRHTSSETKYEEPVKSRSSRESDTQKKTNAGLIVAKYAVLLILFLIVVIVCIKGYNFGYDLFNDVPVDETNLLKVDFTTTGDETDEEMAQKLYDAGLIEDTEMYVYRCKLYDPDYRSGTFKLSKSYNMEKITNILSGYNYSDGTIEEEEEETEAAEEIVAEEGGGEEAVAEEGGGEEAVAEEGGGEWYDEVAEEY